MNINAWKIASALREAADAIEENIDATSCSGIVGVYRGHMVRIGLEPPTSEYIGEDLILTGHEHCIDG